MGPLEEINDSLIIREYLDIITGIFSWYLKFIWKDWRQTYLKALPRRTGSTQALDRGRKTVTMKGNSILTKKNNHIKKNCIRKQIYIISHMLFLVDNFDKLYFSHTDLAKQMAELMTNNWVMNLDWVLGVMKVAL